MTVGVICFCYKNKLLICKKTYFQWTLILKMTCICLSYYYLIKTMQLKFDWYYLECAVKKLDFWKKMNSSCIICIVHTHTIYCSKPICVYYSIVQFYNYIQLYPHTYSKLTVNKLIYYTSTVWLFLSKLYRPGIKRYGTININMIFVKLLWNDVYCELFLTNLLNGWFSDSFVMQSRLWPPTGITV